MVGYVHAEEHADVASLQLCRISPNGRQLDAVLANIQSLVSNDPSTRMIPISSSRGFLELLSEVAFCQHLPVILQVYVLLCFESIYYASFAGRCLRQMIELENILGLMTRRSVLRTRQTILYQMPRRQAEGGGRVRYGTDSNS